MGARLFGYNWILIVSPLSQVRAPVHAGLYQLGVVVSFAGDQGDNVKGYVDDIELVTGSCLDSCKWSHSSLLTMV